MSIEFTRTGVLTYDGSKISVSWDAEVNYPYDLPTGIPFDPYKDMIEDSNSAPPVNNEKDPTDVHAEDFERYYPDELFNLYDLSKIVSWDKIYAAEQNLLKNNANFYNEQLPPLYLMIKELGVTKEEFIRVNDQLNDEQIEVLFSNKKNETIQRELKLDTAFFYKGRLYNIYELSALEPIQLKEMVDEGNMIDYLNVLESIYAGKGNDSEILNDYIDFIKNKIDK